MAHRSEHHRRREPAGGEAGPGGASARTVPDPDRVLQLPGAGGYVHLLPDRLLHVGGVYRAHDGRVCTVPASTRERALV